MATERQRKAFKRWSSETARQQRRQATGVSTTQESVTKYGASTMNLNDLLQLLHQNITVEIVIKIKADEVSTAVLYPAVCDACGWNKEYATADSASRALRAHQYHCSACASDDELAWFKEQVNGK
jgi:predicted Zn-ribbon and HTH transcriptional regulator